MRKIEEGMVKAISKWEDYKKDNISVCSHEEGAVFRVYLHGHMIVEKQDNDLWLSDCGYQTKTTKSRLNCILHHFNLPTIYAKKFQWFIGDEEWTGTKTFELELEQKEVMKAWIS